MPKTSKKTSKPTSTSEPVLADPLMRILAKLLDGLIGVAPFFCFLFLIFPAALTTPKEQLETSLNPFLDQAFFWTLLAILVVFVVQIVFLTKDGQTLGKKCFGIRIVDAKTKKNRGFVENVLLRSWLHGLLCAVPLYSFVDAILLFLEDYRTLHDRIAGTIVVNTR